MREVLGSIPRTAPTGDLNFVRTLRLTFHHINNRMRLVHKPHYRHGHVAYWIRRWSSEPKIASSSLARVIPQYGDSMKRLPALRAAGFTIIVIMHCFANEMSLIMLVIKNQQLGTNYWRQSFCAFLSQAAEHPIGNQEITLPRTIKRCFSSHPGRGGLLRRPPRPQAKPVGGAAIYFRMAKNSGDSRLFLRF